MFSKVRNNYKFTVEVYDNEDLNTEVYEVYAQSKSEALNKAIQLYRSEFYVQGNVNALILDVEEL